MAVIRTRMHNQLILTLAVTGALLSACSKNDSGNNGPVPPPTPTPLPTVTATGPGANGSSGQLGNAPTPSPTATPTPNPENSDNAPPGSADAGDGTQGGSENSTPHSGHHQKPLPPPPKPNSGNGNSNSPHSGSGELVLDPTGLKPEQIFEVSALLGAPAPGAPAPTDNGEALVYSGAGYDELHAQLLAHVGHHLSQAQVAANKKLISQLGMATFEVDWNSRAAKFSIDVGPDGHRRNLNFTGTLDNQLRLSGGEAKAKGLKFVATCMDVDGGCHNVQIQIKKEIDQVAATVNLITRLSSAYLYIEGNPPGVSHNPEYDNFMNLLLNTVRDRGGPRSVQALAFYTSEIIGGASQFAILMRFGVQDPARARGQAQMMGLIGPLVKSAAGINENVLIANPPTEPTRMGTRQFLLSEEIVNTIRDIRMVRNDGRGNLQFEITIRKASAAANEDTVRLTVARIQTLTRDPVLRGK